MVSRRPGIFHDFHNAWIAEIRKALNGGLLPDEFYALTEQHAGDMVADVLALQTGDPETSWGENGGEHHPGATAVAVAKPRVRLTATGEDEAYLAKQRRVVVRRASDDRIVALIEIVSQGNKAGKVALDLFVKKSVEALARGWHLLILDLQPPTPRNPQGIHGAIWCDAIGNGTYHAPEDKPLTLVAYEAAFPKTAYIEPIAIGDNLPEMPLFLAPGWYVNVPLEATYDAAWQGVPRRWRNAVDPPSAG